VTTLWAGRAFGRRATSGNGRCFLITCFGRVYDDDERGCGVWVSSLL
jgi:hypothetical protein